MGLCSTGGPQAGGGGRWELSCAVLRGAAAFVRVSLRGLRPSRGEGPSLRHVWNMLGELIIRKKYRIKRPGFFSPADFNEGSYGVWLNRCEIITSSVPSISAPIGPLRAAPWPWQLHRAARLPRHPPQCFR